MYVMCVLSHLMSHACAMSAMSRIRIRIPIRAGCGSSGCPVRIFCVLSYMISIRSCPLNFVNSTFVFHCFQVNSEFDCTSRRARHQSYESSKSHESNSNEILRSARRHPRRSPGSDRTSISGVARCSPAGPYGTCRVGANRCARVDCPPRAGARHRPSPQPTPCSLSGITPHTDRQTSPSMHTSQATSRAPPSDMRLRALPSPAAFVRTLASTRPPRRPARPHHMHSRGPCLRRGRSLIISPYRLRAACASVRARKFSSLRLASAEGFDLLLRLRSRPAGA